MKKRILSILLTLCMLLTLLPAAALADTEPLKTRYESYAIETNGELAAGTYILFGVDTSTIMRPATGVYNTAGMSTDFKDIGIYLESANLGDYEYTFTKNTDGTWYIRDSSGKYLSRTFVKDYVTIDMKEYKAVMVDSPNNDCKWEVTGAFNNGLYYGQPIIKFLGQTASGQSVKYLLTKVGNNLCFDLLLKNAALSFAIKRDPDTIHAALYTLNASFSKVETPVAIQVPYDTSYANYALPDIQVISGWTTTGWMYPDGTGNYEPVYEPGRSIVLNDGAAYFAAYERSVTLNFDSNTDDTTATTPEPVTGNLKIKTTNSGYRVRETPTMPDDLTRDGYIFLGWYRDAACQTPFIWDASTVTAEMTLYARWAIPMEKTDAAASFDAIYGDSFTLNMGDYIANTVEVGGIERWTVKEGSALPDGLTLTGGTVSGIFDKAGTYTSILTATANNGATMEVELDFTVDRATVAIDGVSPATDLIYITTAPSAVALSHTDGTAGVLALTAGQTLTVGTKNYGWTFTPENTNYKSDTGTVSLTVLDDALESIAVTTAPNKTTYRHGETFDNTGIVVTGTYESGAKLPMDNSLVSVIYCSGAAFVKGDEFVTLSYHDCTATQAVTVSNGEAPTLAFGTPDIPLKYTTTGARTAALSGIPADAGATTYAVSVDGTNPGIVTAAAVNSNPIAFTLNGGEIGNTAAVTVTVTMENYETASATMNIRLMEKESQNPLILLSETTVAYDGTLTLATTGGSGTGEVSYAVTDGTGAATVDGAVLTATKAGTVTVTATRAGDNDYNPVTSEPVTITISKATPTGAPTYTRITTTGKTLGDAALAIGSITPAGGTITWDLGNDQPVAANTAYAWTYTPATADQANYNSLTGSITPYSVSTGGGTATTPTTDTPATSGNTTTVTTTVTPSTSGTTATATVTEKAVTDAATSAVTEAAKNNTQPVVEIKVNSSATATEVQTTIPAKALDAVGDSGADLQITTPVGNVILPAEVVSSIASAAGTANATLTVKTVEKNALTQAQQDMLGSSDAPIIDLTLTAGGKTISQLGGTATVSIPYTPKAGENMSQRVVWFLADDGSITPCKGSFDAKTNTYTFEVTHFSAYVLATFPFTDVAENAWYYGDVAYAYTNALFAGTSDTTFSPNATMTRGMIATVLWRMEESPSMDGMYANFSDVAQGSYYETAIGWAAKNGIAGGYGEGMFGPDNAITREQLAAILYRYAQYKGYDVSVGEDTNILSYNDVAQVSEYAIPAMQWACGAVLISGSDNNLMPKNSATRAQVAAILHRFMENLDK